MRVTHEGVDYVFCVGSYDCHRRPLDRPCYRCGGSEWDRLVLRGCEVGTLFQGNQLNLHGKCMTAQERVCWEGDE